MTGTYHAWIVALSVVVAILVSYAALNVSARIARAKGLGGRLWLAGGAITMGVGIWSMHFIGMMAFHLPIPLAYDIVDTIASLLLAIGASAYALKISSAPQLPVSNIAQSAVILGLGISAMHYVGMDAITIQPGVHYQPRLFAASVLLAIAASFTALWLFFRLRHGRGWMVHMARLAAALVMGLAICGMHYVGMAATIFAPGAYCVGGVVLDQGWLAITVAIVALGLIAITSGLLLVDMHMASKARQHAAQLERANQKLSHAATHDALTGLPNRTLLADRLQHAVAQAQRQGTAFALVAIDLDRFKAVNDSLGHAAGDDLLRELAARLLPQLRASDTLARIGGDEFVALLPEASEREGTALVLKKIQQEIARPMRLAGTQVEVSSSIGVAFYPTDARDANTLQKHADAALYEAKHAGRDNFQFFASSMTAYAREKQELEAALQQGLADNQFVLHYLPQVDMRSGRVEQLEALLRWQHPTRGLLLPGDFLEVAEETGMIRAIGAWALREACSQLRRWHEAGYGALSVTVNLSAEQLQQPDLADIVRSVLRETKIDPGSVELDFTETALMHDVKHSGKVLTQLVRMGLRIALDDFGTGYSSLNYLRRLPLHVVKIDRRFVHEAENQIEDAEIVRAMVSLAHCLRLQAIAEGVETSGQLEFLRSTGCDAYQGYLYSPPLTPEQCAEILRPITPTQRLRVLGRLTRARLMGESSQTI